jgi:hypothetical protein
MCRGNRQTGRTHKWDGLVAPKSNEGGWNG